MVQTIVNTQPAPAIAGDFCDSNPRFTVNAGPGGLVAGPGGVTVGRFAWATSSPADPDGAALSVSNSGPPTGGAPTGFVHREQQALITAFLAPSGMVVPQGLPIVLHSGGGFWVKNEGTTQALPGMSVFASFANGAATFAAAGSAISSASVTGAIAAVATGNITGFITGNVLTVTGSGTQALVPGAILTGTSALGNIPTGLEVISQLSGTIGGVGTYAVSVPELSIGRFAGDTVGASGISATYGLLTISAVSAGTVTVGGTVTGAGVSNGTLVTGFGSGAGLSGTYFVNLTQTVGSEALTIGSNVQTKWLAMSAGLPGELVKITDHALG